MRCSRADALAFAREEGLRFPVLLDIDGRVSRLWDAASCPRCAIIRDDGVLAYRSDPDLTAAALADRVQRRIACLPRLAADETTGGTP